MRFEHFIIRPLALEDLHAYYNLIDINRKRLEDFFTGTVSRTKTFEETGLFIQELITKAEAKTYFPFVIEDTTSNSIIGFIDIKNIDWNIPKAELGCYIDEKYAAKGISTKAIKLFTDYCFDHFGFKKIFLRTHETNTAARKVAENCGFEIEGTIRRDYKTTAGELVDLIYYGKLSQE